MLKCVLGGKHSIRSITESSNLHTKEHSYGHTQATEDGVGAPAPLVCQDGCWDGDGKDNDGRDARGEERRFV